MKKINTERKIQKIGFIGRTKILYDTIKLIKDSGLFKVSFIWTCIDENYYNFSWKNFKTLAIELGCPFFYSSDTKKKEFNIDADLVISVNFINVIQESFINKFKYGILNAHAGDLPRYKGNACPNWEIINSEKEIILSIHFMEKDLDSGPIILKEKYLLTQNTYIGEIYEWLEKQTPISFLTAIDKINKGKDAQKQTGRTLRTFPRKPEDSKLDFNQSLDWNYRLIRASSRPFSGAYAYLNKSKSKLKIFKAIPHNVNYEFNAISGQIIEKCENELSFLIVIGNEVLKITDYSVDDLGIKESFKIICSSLRNRLT